MDKSYVPCILTELRFVKSQMRILGSNRTYTNIPKEDVTTFLSRAIALIECLDTVLEDCENELTTVRKVGNQIAEEKSSLRDENLRLKNRITELIRDRDSVVEYWTKHCENLFSTHRKCLAEKDREIYKLKLEKSNQVDEETSKIKTQYELAKKLLYQRRAEISQLKRERDKNSDSVTYWKCRCHKLEEEVQQVSQALQRELLKEPEYIKVNNPQNFCGNCRYCKIDPNEGTAVCTHSRVTTYWLDPDAASCCYFESNQVDRDKPDHPCCKACNRDNCDNCTLCPF